MKYVLTEQEWKDVAFFCRLTKTQTAKVRAYIESQPLGFFNVEASLIGEIKAYFEKDNDTIKPTYGDKNNPLI